VFVCMQAECWLSFFVYGYFGMGRLSLGLAYLGVLDVVIDIGRSIYCSCLRQSLLRGVIL
jgi:hypothetical protein